MLLTRCEQILQNTRERLVNNYQQIPQLSCGGRYDLDQALLVRLEIIKPESLGGFRVAVSEFC